MEGFNMEQWVDTITFAVAAIVVYILIKYHGFKIFERLVSKTQFSFDTELVMALRTPIALIVAHFLVLAAAENIPGVEAQEVEDLDNLLSALIDTVVLYAIYQLLKYDSSIFKSIIHLLRIERDSTLTHLLANIVKMGIITLFILMFSRRFDYNVTGLVAGIGIGGIAIALAAQETLSNVIGGVALVVDSPFDNGDWIQTSDVEGVVESSSFRSTRIRTFTQGLVTIPHANLAKAAITNWSRMEKRRVRFSLGVSYATTEEQLQNCMQDIENILLASKTIDHDNYLVIFDGYGASSLDILISYYVLITDSKEYFKIKSEINFKIMNVLAKNNVSVAFPSQSVYFETPLPIESKASATCEWV